MKKLLLASVSVMAFVSSAANANVQPEKINLSSLINTAMTNVKMADVLPANDAHIVVKKQSKAILSEETQISLHNSLLAFYNDAESKVEESKGNKITDVASGE
jgi:opacity protein-like surface antigen